MKTNFLSVITNVYHCFNVTECLIDGIPGSSTCCSSDIASCSRSLLHHSSASCPGPSTSPTPSVPSSSTSLMVNPNSAGMLIAKQRSFKCHKPKAQSPTSSSK
jgi:hypothetical protein